MIDFWVRKNSSMNVRSFGLLKQLIPSAGRYIFLHFVMWSSWGEKLEGKLLRYCTATRFKHLREENGAKTGILTKKIRPSSLTFFLCAASITQTFLYRETNQTQRPIFTPDLHYWAMYWLKSSSSEVLVGLRQRASPCLYTQRNWTGKKKVG